MNKLNRTREGNKLGKYQFQGGQFQEGKGEGSQDRGSLIMQEYNLISGSPHQQAADELMKET